MVKLLRIGIVGCGAIGSSLAKIITVEFSEKAQLAGLYDIDLEKARKLANHFNNDKLTALNLDDLLNMSDLVIEASKADSVFDIAKKAISASRDIMIMSVGGIVNRYQALKLLAEKRGARIYIPSGAVCGIDGLKAAACSKINKVTLTTKKPARAFQGVRYVTEKKINLDSIKEDTVIFEGDADTATKEFPQNINVAAVLSLAGIGPKETKVRIVVSPHAKTNIHEIEIESDSGKIFTRTENIIHPDNPKTSYLAVLSAVATLKQILESVRIGI